jgi:hypothetical protein
VTKNVCVCNDYRKYHEWLMKSHAMCNDASSIRRSCNEDSCQDQFRLLLRLFSWTTCAIQTHFICKTGLFLGCWKYSYLNTITHAFSKVFECNMNRTWLCWSVMLIVFIWWLFRIFFSTSNDNDAWLRPLSRISLVRHCKDRMCRQELLVEDRHRWSM